MFPESLERLYGRSGNALIAWHSLEYSRRSAAPGLPGWIASYLDRCADNVLRLAWGESGRSRLSMDAQVAVALELKRPGRRGPGSSFSRYREACAAETPPSQTTAGRRGRGRDIRRLAALHAATGNALFAWEAVAAMRREMRASLPAWVADYLDRCARSLLALAKRPAALPRALDAEICIAIELKRAGRRGPGTAFTSYRNSEAFEHFEIAWAVREYVHQGHKEYQAIKRVAEDYARNDHWDDVDDDPRLTLLARPGVIVTPSVRRQTRARAHSRPAAANAPSVSKTTIWRIWKAYKTSMALQKAPHAAQVYSL